MAWISQEWLVMKNRSLALFALSSMVLVSTAACLGRVDGSPVPGDPSIDSYPTSSGVVPSPSTPPSTPRPSASTPPSGTRPGATLPPEKPWDGATWDGGAWAPGNAPASLADAKQQMLGTWIGVARTPWRPPYLVRLSFASTGPFTGTYTSQCIDSHGDCVGMYYGTDANLPNKTFGLETVKSNGDRKSVV